MTSVYTYVMCTLKYIHVYERAMHNSDFEHVYYFAIAVINYNLVKKVYNTISYNNFCIFNIFPQNS